MREQVYAVMMAVVLACVSAAGQVSGNTTETSGQAWNPPQTPDGQPDIQGFWSGYQIPQLQDNLEEGSDSLNDAVLGRTHRPVHVIVDPPDQKIPYQPWALAKRDEHYKHSVEPRSVEDIDPHGRCFLPGVPRALYGPGGKQIIQTPGYVLILYDNAYRVIPIDGRPHAGSDINLWMGDSRGHWEGTTLVVDVSNHNGRTWLDSVGNFHTDALHVVERYTIIDANTINYEVRMDDPNVYTRPWTFAFQLKRSRDEGMELLEYACYEGWSVERMLHRR